MLVGYFGAKTEFNYEAALPRRATTRTAKLRKINNNLWRRGPSCAHTLGTYHSLIRHPRESFLRILLR